MEAETLYLKHGQLGPIRKFPESGLRLCPLTLFIGKQGTGKSLVSQIVYFFRNLPFLVQFYRRASRRAEIDPQTIARRALNSLRSSWRALSVFAEPSVSVVYAPPDGRKKIGFQMDKRDRLVTIHQGLWEEIERLKKFPCGPLENAVYIPAERVLYSYVRAPEVWMLLPFPSTLNRFAAIMEEVGETFKNWSDGEPDTEEGQRVRALGRGALAGEVFRVGDYLKWDFGGKERLDIDMASSGQKASWPLVLLAEALFTWRKKGEVIPDFALHIEEPEIHLHPEAQVAMVKILAYLVNHGFRVLVTTHSLTILYTTNNLLAASDLPEEIRERGIPEPEFRLKPGRVGAYFFREDGEVVNLVHPDTGLLSEAELAAVGEQLIVEANRIDYLLPDEV